ncbi:MAG: energy transducer TonB [Gammaproteobacteria bacterium]|nr:energy transducer TonB [Gammaproteobacteria bacterium]
MNPRTRHWLLPLAGAAGLHAAVALAWLGTRAPAPELGGAATEGIDVSLALAGAEAPAAPAEAMPEPAPQPAAPPPPPAAKPKLAPKPVARPVPAAAPVEPVATLPSEPAPAASAETATTASTDTAEAPIPDPAVSSASAAPRSGGQAGGNAGARSRFNGKPARNIRGYFGQISAWIDANKDYPTEVKKKKQQGTVVVRFTIGRDGQLLASTIKQSSGHVLLDQAALETLARAAPFPPIPEFVGRETLSIAVPIDYTLITD